jgi:hypothetical protein
MWTKMKSLRNYWNDSRAQELFWEGRWVIPALEALFRFLIGSCFNSGSTISLRRSGSCWGTCLFWSVGIFFPSHLLGCILCKVAGRLAISTSNYLNKINNKHFATRNVVRLIRGTQVRVWERWGEIIFSVTTLDVIFIFRRLLLHVRTILVYNCIEVDPKESRYKKSSQFSIFWYM